MFQIVYTAAQQETLPVGVVIVGMLVCCMNFSTCWIWIIQVEDDITDKALLEALFPSNPGKGSCTDQEHPDMLTC